MSESRSPDAGPGGAAEHERPSRSPVGVIAGRGDQPRPVADLVAELLGALGDGRGRVLWVEGPPGAGKSTVVGTVLAAAAAAGHPAFRSAADELTRPLPLRLMADCLRVSGRSTDPLRAEIAALLVTGAAPGVVDPVAAAGARLVELVRRSSAAGPIVLVAEDLHWADQASLGVWTVLARDVDRAPLLLVGSCRPTPPADVLRLRPAGMREGVLLQLDPPADQPAAQPTADRLAARLAGLDLDGRAVVGLAALLGAEFAVADLALVTGRPASALAPVLAEAAAAGLLAGGGSRYAFRPGSVALAVRAALSPTDRADAHEMIARMLADAGAPAGRVAAHLLGGPKRLADWALDWLSGQPEPVLRTAPQAATELLAAAVAACPADDPRWLALAARLAALLDWQDRNDELDQTVAAALHQLDRRAAAAPAGDGELAARMVGYRALAAYRSARYEQSLRYCREVLDGGGLPPEWAGRLRAQYALALNASGAGPYAAAQARQAVAEGEQAGDGLSIGRARLVLYFTSSDTEGLAELDQGMAALGDDADSTDLRLRLLNNRATSLANLDRWDEYGQTISEALAAAERAGSPTLATMRVTAAWTCYDRGSWDEAKALLNALSPPLSSHQLLATYGLQAVIACRRDQRGRAAEHLARAAEQVPAAPGPLRASAALLTLARAVAAEMDGDLPGAVDVLASWLDPTRGATYGRHEWMPDLVRLALAAGDTDTAREAVLAVEADAAAEPLPFRVADARRCRAQLADDAAGLLAAADYYRRVGRRIELAGTLEEAAVRLARHGDAAGAQAALAEAVGVYATVGASWDIRRADTRLRPYGLRAER